MGGKKCTNLPETVRKVSYGKKWIYLLTVIFLHTVKDLWTEYMLIIVNIADLNLDFKNYIISLRLKSVDIFEKSLTI